MSNTDVYRVLDKMQGHFGELMWRNCIEKVQLVMNMHCDDNFFFFSSLSVSPISPVSPVADKMEFIHTPK